MSQINFVDLVKQNPRLSGTLRAIDAWLDTHKSSAEVDPRTLGNQLVDIDAVDIAQTLLLLLRAGYLTRVYKVLTPSGVYAEGEFDDPTGIPDRLPDRFHHYFETAEADIIPVFKRRA
jgi:hypothetical protein